MDYSKYITVNTDAIVSPKKEETEERTLNSNRYHGDGSDICYCCGKAIKDFDPATSRMIHIIDGGNLATEDDDPTLDNDPGDMGWFPIGPVCYRKFKKAIAK